MRVPTPAPAKPGGDGQTAAPQAGPPPPGAPAPGDTDRFIGRRIGSYKLIKLLGRGGMGSVYLGEHQVIGSRVAVKILHSAYSREPEIVKRFYSEARAVNLIGHENIVQVFDLDQAEDGANYCVMEYLEGESLSERAARGPMKLEEAGPLVIQMANALQAAHAHGIIHRDLKPDNIFLVNRMGRTMVKVLDFGIAKLHATSADEQTAVGAILGTPQFMPPEQAGGAQVDERADVYALGVIMYRIATGRLPFDAPTLAEILIMQIQKPPDPPRSVNPEISPQFEAVILKALAKRPKERYQTMAEVADAMQLALDSVAKPPPPAAVPAPAPIAVPTDRVLIEPITLKGKPGTRSPQYRVRVEMIDLARLRRIYLSDISKGGMFVATGEKVPPQFTPLEVIIVAPEGKGEVSLHAEVVRSVTPAEAAAWHSPPGMAVQFLNLDAQVRQRLELMVSGLPTPRPTTMRSAAIKVRIAEAEKLLAMFDAMPNATPYDLLSVSPQADASTIRDAARRLLRDTEPESFGGVSAEMLERLNALQSRLKSAEQQLTNPSTRAQYDATTGNYVGVWWALKAGLKLDELATLRKSYLTTHAAAESGAQPHMRQAVIAERDGRIDHALAALDKALKLDPLNIALHHRYWALKRPQTRQ
jgi:eukaryotic-like serine/threonine-protein kinase